MQIARFLLASESAATLIPIFSSSSTDYVPYQLIHTFSQLSHFKISMESQAEISRCQSKVIYFRKNNRIQSTAAYELQPFLS